MAEIFSNEIVIMGIDIAATILTLIAIFYAYKMFQRTKKSTDIWLLIGFAVFILFLISLSSAAERYPYLAALFAGIQPYKYETLDILGEYLNILFSITWIYIAYRFILFGKLE
ncbi:hypothetical protein HYT53_05620 [Candidatus Woesearchaeota archaeon]|nr:hypothetical protein [Candidatus Woesearchaeota archaeon]